MEEKWPWKEPRHPVTRGAFIVIEGLDRSGKTTQVERLCNKLYSLGHNIKAMGFPDRTSTVGQMIGNYLQNMTEMDDHAIHLLFSANRWEKVNWIEDTLSAGYNIVCDRYYMSGIAYSVAKKNPPLTIEWAKNSEVGLPCPDAIVFLDILPEEAEKRAGYGVEKYERREFQEQIRTLFLRLLLSSQEEGIFTPKIDAGLPIDVVQGEILAAVENIIISAQAGFMGKYVSRIKQ
ncbi:Thymidylate kinase [Golovinomyces cichoracearum]|uniref:Thymidylate kinase n=1 Tax=Golovinomyces cichoracearum TaxID=62708 RepID=A0A420I9A7_9PEZI|nr:Thymidylate kinase [Golovinomyces cichoracearum]